MSTFTLLAALFTCLTLASAADPAPAPHTAGWVADQDGVALYLRLPEGASSAKPEVACEVVNTSDSPVPVDFHTVTSLGFRLFDSAGREIKHVPKWWRMNDPNASDVGRHMVQMLMPGKGFVHILKLDEAFGPEWSKGTTLQVEHFPGTDGKGGLIMQGRGLRGRIDITPLVKAGQGTHNGGNGEGVNGSRRPGKTDSPAGDDGKHETHPVNGSPSATPASASQGEAATHLSGNLWLWILGVSLMLLLLLFALVRMARG